MKRTLVIAGLLAGLLLSGALLAAATNPGAGVLGAPTVEPAPLHVGDELRYERAWTDYEGELHLTTTFAVVEGITKAQDRFGIERDALAVRLTTLVDGEPRVEQRCFALAGGVDLVRRDILAGDYFMMGTVYQGNVLDVVETWTSTTVFAAKVFFEGECPGASPLAGRTLREGDTLPLTAAAGSGADLRHLGVADASHPGVATTFNGRDALSFTFPALEGPGAFTVVYADGLPGPVEATFDDSGYACFEYGCLTTDDERIVSALAGIRPGESTAIDTASGLQLPRTNPSGVPASEPLVLDDAAYALDYPFDAAFDAVVNDPTLCVADFFTAHPDAWLEEAEYEAEARDFLARDAPTEGGWTLDWRAGDEHCLVYTFLLAAPTGLPGPRPVRNYPASPFDYVERDLSAGDGPAEAPATLASSAMLADLAQLEGHDVAGTKWLRYHTYRDGDGATKATLRLSSVSPAGGSEDGRVTGLLVELDPVAGAVRTVQVGEGETKSEVGLDDGMLAITFERTRLASFLEGPARGQGLAATVVVGLALLVLVKFVVLPLYTRLVRSALLDNPTRARLYEAIRREPGIHRAELIDYSGTGAGATTRHLDQLTKHHYLVAFEDGGFVRYYAAGDVPPDAARKAATLRNETTRRVYDLYTQRPQATLREASHELDISAPAVHRHKKKLESAGLLPAPATLEAMATT